MDFIALSLKSARPKALSTLVRLLGDIDSAEEAVQESMVRALSDWRRKGVPDNPVAWLVKTGRRYAMDIARHDQIVLKHHENLMYTEIAMRSVESQRVDEDSHLPDDMLRLIFTCCHPVLKVEAQVALTLKTIAGLDRDAIARAFLKPPKTVEQRLTRAKRKIRENGFAYQVPGEDELSARLQSVQKVIYLIYNQSYTLVKGPDLLDKQLAETAIGLARTLCGLLPAESDSLGLLALLLMQHARSDARTDSEGFPVPLERQNRSLWKRTLIHEGGILIEKGFRSRRIGPYLIQAAIASAHNQAATPDETPWQDIVQLYEWLEQIHPSPVVTLNRAIAVARATSPEKGLKLLDSLESLPQMQCYQYYHSSRAALQVELGQYSSALNAYERALSACRNQSEARYIKRQIEKLSNC